GGQFMTASRRDDASLVREGDSGSPSGSSPPGNSSDSSSSNSSDNGTKPLGKSALTALQAALAAEQAAAWSYGLVAAYNPQASDTFTEMVTSHQSTRNVAVDLLTQAGAVPHVPAAAYSTPFPVNDAASALKLALVIESDCAASWRSVIGHTDDS